MDKIDKRHRLVRIAKFWCIVEAALGYNEVDNKRRGPCF